MALMFAIRKKEFCKMRNIIIFIIFCCAVGCGAVLSFYYYGNDWLAVTASSAEDDA